VGPGSGSNSVWAKPSFGSSVLGRAAAKPSEPSSTSFQGNLFADVDPSRQVEVSRQVQIRQQNYAQAVKQMNEVRMSADPGVTSFPIMKTFGDITSASGNDMVGFCLWICRYIEVLTAV